MKKAISFLVTGLIMASVMVGGSAHAFAASPAVHTGGPSEKAARPVGGGQFDLYVFNKLNGKPIAGAKVSLFDATGNQVPGSSSAGTDENGYFGTALPAGGYKFVVKAAGYEEFSQRFTVTVFETTNAKAALTVTVPDPGPMPQPSPEPNPDPCASCIPQPTPEPVPPCGGCFTTK